jgi:selenocysteine lyase/cysteine desulfurase
MLESLGQEFAALDGMAYFDTPTQGVPPARGTEALREAIGSWESGDADWKVWEVEAEYTRKAAAILLGCTPTDVALVPSVVVAAATVAAQLPPGRVIVADREYRSNLLPWLAQRRFGRETTVLGDEELLSVQIAEELEKGAALVAVSSVQSCDGSRVDLRRVVSAAHEHGALVFVDATQSAGVLETAVQDMQPDFLAVAGYKWLLGARGTGYFYVRPELQSTYMPVLASPKTASDVLEGKSYGGPYEPFEDARRFDQSLAWLSWVAARPGLEMLVRLGIKGLERHALELASYFRVACNELGIKEGLSKTELPSPIVALSVPDASGLHRELGRHGVKASVRPSGIRFGFHLYNDYAQVDRALKVVARHWKTARSDGRISTDRVG